MTQPIPGSSLQRASLAPSTLVPVTPPATIPVVSARSDEVPPFLIVKAKCSEGLHFDHLGSEHGDQNIHTLVLGGSHLFVAMWNYLMNYLDRTPVLQTLDLSQVEMGMEESRTRAAFTFFMRLLKQMPRNLILRNCSINSRAIEPIANRLKVDKKLQTLDLAENHLCAANIQSLADSLQTNQTLSGLNLASNRLDTTSVPALTGLMANSQSLQKLDLSDNLFTAEDKTRLQQATAARAGTPLELVL